MEPQNDPERPQVGPQIGPKFDPKWLQEALKMEARQPTIFEGGFEAPRGGGEFCADPPLSPSDSP